MPTIALAAPLDFAVDASLGSGLSLAGSGETISTRSPTYLDVDTGVRLDGDDSIEWGLGLTLQLENTTAAAVTPRVRLLRGPGPLRGFAGIGIPVFITPFTLFGGELGGGALYSLSEAFAVVTALKVDVFLAGSDLPEDQTLVMFNLGVGARVEF